MTSIQSIYTKHLSVEQVHGYIEFYQADYDEHRVVCYLRNL